MQRVDGSLVWEQTWLDHRGTERVSIHEQPADVYFFNNRHPGLTPKEQYQRRRLVASKTAQLLARQEDLGLFIAACSAD